MSQANIYNPTTGQTGYQVPGAAPMPGWLSGAPPANPSTTILSTTNGQKIAGDLTNTLNQENVNVTTANEKTKNTQEATRNGVKGYYDNTGAFVPSTDTSLPPEVTAEASAAKTPYDKQIADQKAENDASFKTYTDSMDSLALANTATTQGLINTITTTYQQNRQALEQINKVNQALFTQAGVRSGASRYAPEMNVQMLTQEAQAGLSKLQDLDAKYQNALAEANNALSQKNYTLAAEKAKSIMDYKNETLKQLQTQQKDVRDMADKLRTYNFQVSQEKAKVQKDIDTIMKEVTVNGAPQAIKDAVLNSTSVTEAIQAAGQYAGDNLDRQLKQAQLEQAKASTQKIITETAASSPTVIAAKAQSSMLDTVSLIDSVLASPNLSVITGLSKYTPSAWLPGSSAIYTKNQLNQIINSLSLENRQKLKGQGAISDFEAKMLEGASSALSPSMADEDVKRELSKIKGILSTAGGLTATVKITDPTSGQSRTLEASRQGINQAIIDGLTVEYQ